MYKVIKSGSTGNAVIYHNNIMVDCGVTFASVLPFLYDIQIILLTHVHKDHFNLKTLKKIQSERPTLRIGCGEWLENELKGFKNVDIYEIGQIYDYNLFKISPIKLYHDVPNCGYRIFKDNTKIIHATDTAHLQGITAKDYDLYAIEHNYNEDTVYDIIEYKTLNGEFTHEKGAINSHLSEQQARDFIFKNAGTKYEVLRLHESKIIH
jgi:L-ascorbate metabolism protein UlaG (beta-lactamase superfamily)